MSDCLVISAKFNRTIIVCLIFMLPSLHDSVCNYISPYVVYNHLIPEVIVIVQYHYDILSIVANALKLNLPNFRNTLDHCISYTFASRIPPHVTCEISDYEN